jgi:hypothetical protein
MGSLCKVKWASVVTSHGLDCVSNTTFNPREKNDNHIIAMFTSLYVPACQFMIFIMPKEIQIL